LSTKLHTQLAPAHRGNDPATCASRAPRTHSNFENCLGMLQGNLRVASNHAPDRLLTAHYSRLVPCAGRTLRFDCDGKARRAVWL
jgi:hypothetical protein